MPMRRQPLGQPEVAPAELPVDAETDARGRLEGAADFPPARVGEDGGQGDQLLALGHGREHALSQHERFRREVVGAIRERFDERDEQLELVEADVLHEVAAHVEEAGREARRLPGPAREAFAERGPARDVTRGKRGQDAGAGAEVRSSYDGRLLHQVDAALDPPLELREADDPQDLGRGAEVLRGGFPGAGALRRDPRPFLSPPHERRVADRPRRPALAPRRTRQARRLGACATRR